MCVYFILFHFNLFHVSILPGGGPVRRPAPAFARVEVHHEGEGPRPAGGCGPEEGVAFVLAPRVGRARG